jgi:hypothetical protein
VTDEISIRAPAKVADLTQAGFVRVGKWRLTESGDGLVLDGRAERIAGVYVYTVDGEVRYVGSAQRGLHRRLQRYITSKMMRTSARIRGKIIECLKKECLVEVFTLSPPAFDWGGLPVDLVAGLEEGLIRSMKDLWNIRSHRRS